MSDRTDIIDRQQQTLHRLREAYADLGTRADRAELHRLQVHLREWDAILGALEIADIRLALGLAEGFRAATDDAIRRRTGLDLEKATERYAGETIDE